MVQNFETPYETLLGNGTKTGYSFVWTYADSTEIEIFYTPDGGTRVQLSTSDYKLIPASTGIGGNITFETVTPTANDKIEIRRKTPVDQQIDFVGKGYVSPKDAEYAWNKLTRICQEILYKLVGIASIPPATTGTNGQLLTINGGAYVLRNSYVPDPKNEGDNKVLVTDSGGLVYQKKDDANSLLPPQQNHAGEYLSTDGSTLSWKTAINPFPAYTGHAGESLKVNSAESGVEWKPDNSVQIQHRQPLGKCRQNKQMVRLNIKRHLQDCRILLVTTAII